MDFLSAGKVGNSLAGGGWRSSSTMAESELESVTPENSDVEQGLVIPIRNSRCTIKSIVPCGTNRNLQEYKNKVLDSKITVNICISLLVSSTSSLQ